MVAIASGAPFVAERGQGPAEIMRQREKLKELQRSLIAESGPDGMEGSLFSGGVYDADDRVADDAYAAVDKYVGAKKTAAGAAAAAASEKSRNTEVTDSIRAQFADVRRDLATLTEADWRALPDSADYSRQNRLTNPSVNRVTYTAAPDSLIMAGAAGATAGAGSAGGGGGFTTTADGADQGEDLGELGRARGQALEARLDRAAGGSAAAGDGSGGGYLSDLDAYAAETRAGGSGGGASAATGDVKRLRALYKAATVAHPTHGPSWLAAARLELAQGRAADARRIIALACEAAPTNEDVWLEAADLHGARARAVLAQAVRTLPQSTRLWLRAAAAEAAPEARRAVLRRALELLPRSEQLWKAAVALEEPEDAKILLSRAVELVPGALDLWLALARLEPYDAARSVLNAARRALPGERAVWLAAARLEEARGNDGNVAAVVAAAVRSLDNHSNTNGCGITRDEWLSEAVAAEREGALVTCKAIVTATAARGLETLSADERLTRWRGDARRLLSDLTPPAVDTARSLLLHAVSTHSDNESLWLEVATFEATHGDLTLMQAVLSKAVERCPQTEVLWLQAAKLARDQGSVDTARAILDRAFQANPRSEEIWLAAAKVEFDAGEVTRARALLTRAREVAGAGTPRVWMRSAKYARVCGDSTAERALLDGGVKRYPREWKLWLMLAQHHAHAHADAAATRIAYKAGAQHCPDEPRLWVEYVRFERSPLATRGPGGGGTAAGDARARAVMERARAALPASDLLWAEAVRLEVSAGGAAAALQLLARAQRPCPDSGLLWALAVELETRQLRKARVQAALAKCGDHPRVLLAVARWFWERAKPAEARQWFNRATEAAPAEGDAWVYYHRFETEQAAAARAAAEADARAVANAATAGEAAALAVGGAGRALGGVGAMKAEVKAETDALAAAVAAGAGDAAGAGVKMEDSSVRPALTPTGATTVASSSSSSADAAAAAEAAAAARADALVAAVENRCAAARPRYGDLWAPVWKRDALRTPTPVDVLRECSALVTEIFGRAVTTAHG
jgi:pre-mRNA-processing factor 6